MIELIRSSRDPDAARDGLMEKFELSREQAQAILDLRLQRLTAMESDTIKREHADLVERIAELRAILGDESRVMGLIKEELLEIKDRYGDERRTDITHAEGDIDIEDLIADQQMVISITKSGYIKSLPLATYRQQKRGGIGVRGMDMKEEDYIEHLFVTSTHDFLLFFTNRGKVYRQKVYDLPEASRTSKGRALVNVLPLREGEFVSAVQATRDFSEGKYLVFATRNGMIKKTEFKAYNTPIKADGIIAIKIREGDELVEVRRTEGEDDIIMVSRNGKASRFNTDKVRPMGRDTSGVKGMNVSEKGNYVLAMDIARDDTDLLVVTENGFGKRTAIADYPVKGRGTMGVQTIKLTDKKGALAARADRARARRARLHLAERDGPANAGEGHLALRPRLAGRQRDEPARRRHRERGGAGDGGRGGHGREGGGGPADRDAGRGGGARGGLRRGRDVEEPETPEQTEPDEAG